MATRAAATPCAEILAGWRDDLDPAWRAVVGGVEPGFDRDRSRR